MNTMKITYALLILFSVQAYSCFELNESAQKIQCYEIKLKEKKISELDIEDLISTVVNSKVQRNSEKLLKLLTTYERVFTSKGIHSLIVIDKLNAFDQHYKIAYKACLEYPDSICLKERLLNKLTKNELISLLNALINSEKTDFRDYIEISSILISKKIKVDEVKSSIFLRGQIDFSKGMRKQGLKKIQRHLSELSDQRVFLYCKDNQLDLFLKLNNIKFDRCSDKRRPSSKKEKKSRL